MRFIAERNFKSIHGYGQTVGREMSSHPDLEMISFTGPLELNRYSEESI